MSGPVAIVDDVERVLPMSESENTRSSDAIVYIDKTLSSELDGEVSHASFETPGLLPNGESYSGSLLNNMPEGTGNYVWSDGCKYEGEWRCGMRHGYGKLKWPSGAVYEGEFSGGYMHGTGTYTRSDDLSYKGQWRLSLKHGLGYQIFPNGDVFEGSWIQGTQEGPGKYTWADGNVYLGNMKRGKMSDKGSFTWTNGDSYEGSWLNGMMHGFGVYTWSDCGYYVGTWTRGLKDGRGTFYPKGCKVPDGQQLYLNALRKQGLLPDLKKQSQVSYFHHATPVDREDIKVGWNRGSRRNSSKISKGNQSNLEQPCPENKSLVRRWSLEKVIKRDSSPSISESVLEVKDNEDYINSSILEREYMQGVLINELVLSDQFSSSSNREEKRQKKLARVIKRPGEQIIKGHRSYDLMLSLQLGIRYTVGKINAIQRREVRASDFGPRAIFWMDFPKKGSQLTPPHRSEDFKWKDYCPIVFRNLREMFKIDTADYMMSMCCDDALRELSSPGKSGSVFFLSQDARFMIKTLRKFEVKVLLRMLPDYHHHVQTHENTLITKFFGLHRIKPSSGQKFRFVVMGNMFCTELRIHRRFDLKGSSLGRSNDKVEIEESTVLKDLDLNYCFHLEPSWRDALFQQIEIDSKFLESQNIMDYSLLLGVHYRAPQHLRSLMCYSQRMPVDKLGIVAEEESMDEDTSPRGLVLVPRGPDDNTVAIGPHIRGSRLRTGAEEVDLLLPGTARLQIQLGVNMPARADQVPGECNTQMFQEVYDVVLYLGIIDILQDYNVSKKIEHAYKSIQFDTVSISAVNPAFYSQRFLQFIEKVFPQNALQG